MSTPRRSSVDLRVDADAAEDHGGAQRQVLAVGAHALLHLRREFAGRREDQARPDGARAKRWRCGGRQPLQQRQREAGGLAGAGLRGAEQVAPGEHDGDGLRLDGGGFGVALLGDSAEQLGRQAEAFK